MNVVNENQPKKDESPPSGFKGRLSAITRPWQKLGIVAKFIVAAFLIYGGAFTFLLLSVADGPKNKNAGSQPQSLSESFKGTPLVFDENAIKNRAQEDVGRLLKKDYAAYYSSYNSIYDNQFRHEKSTLAVFQKSVDKLLISSNCRFEVQNIRKQEGDFETGPNKIIISGKTSCDTTSFPITIKYHGDGRHPEAFALSHTKIVSTDTSFAQALSEFPKARFYVKYLIAGNSQYSFGEQVAGADELQKRRSSHEIRGHDKKLIARDCEVNTLTSASVDLSDDFMFTELEYSGICKTSLTKK